MSLRGPVSLAVEIKLSTSVSAQDMARLDRTADLISAEHRYIVCQTATPAANSTRGALTLDATIARLKRLGEAGRRIRLRDR